MTTASLNTARDCWPGFSSTRAAPTSQSASDWKCQKKKNERQAEWIKGFELKSYPGKVYEDGVQAIIDTIVKSPGQITMICVGPVPNIAEALKREPGIAKKARFVGMHGSLWVGYNEHKTPVAEFNVKEAPKACEAAFSAPWEVTITPLDTCDKIRLTGEQYQRVYQSADPIASAIITNYKLWAKARHGVARRSAFR